MDPTLDIKSYFREKVPEIVEQQVFQKLEGQVNTFIGVLDRFEQCFHSYQKKLEAQEAHKPQALTEILEVLAFKENILADIKYAKEQLDPEDFSRTWSQYFEAFDQLLAPLPEDVKKTQSPERFKFNADHPFPLSLGLSIKRFFWRISQFPRRLRNIARKWQKKEPLGTLYWKHHIPVHRLATYHLREGVAGDLMTWFIQFYELQSNSLNTLKAEVEKTDAAFQLMMHPPPEEASEPEESPKEGTENSETLLVDKPIFNEIQNPDAQLFNAQLQELDHHAVLESIREQFNQLLSDLKELNQKILEEDLVGFERDFELVGTIELFRWRFSRSKLRKQQQIFNKQFNTVRKIWAKSLDTQLSSWQYKMEIRVLNYFAAKEYTRLELSASKIINKNILQEVQKLTDFVYESYLKLNQFDGEDTELQQLLRMEKVRGTKTLTNDLIPRMVNQILDQTLPTQIQQSEAALARRIEEMPEVLLVAKTNDPTLPIPQAAHEKVSLTSLLSYEALPKFAEASKAIRTSIFAELNQLQAYVTDINQIASFTLDSALAAFTHENTGGEQAQVIAREGLERTMERTNDVYTELNNLFHAITATMRQKVSQFLQDAESLTDLSKLATIKGQIKTAKTIEQGQRFRANAVNYFRNIIPILGYVIGNQYKKLQAYIETLRNRFGLGKTMESITVEIADYLTNTQTAIARLPFVYQRLFRLEPVQDTTFYVPRKETMKELNRALQSWQQGNYAPTVLISERGGGSSTILNFFLEEQKGKVRALKCHFERIPTTEVAFLQKIAHLLGKPDLETKEELIELANGLQKPVILVLEEIHHLFAKKVNGFDLLHLLFELISATNRNVFWLCSCALHSWEYLDKTIKISDFVAYAIHITNLKNEEIIETILKRHRVSGYNVTFLPSAQVGVSKRLRRTDNPKEQQKILQEEYFSRLCNFAKSNISLAILYWLRSTQKVESNTIFIGIDEPDFNFLNALNNEKLFIIYDILLHDGMSELQLAHLRAEPLHQSRLDLLNLYDDGILVREKELYLVNMLLYRPLLRLLRSRNILQ
ncbi:MAG: hypothetical protein AAFV80_06380 [Bacteroidota bacterium]